MKNDSNRTKPKALTGRQVRTIAALLSEPSVKLAAAAAGVGESSVFRWLNDDTFREHYLEARRKAVEQTTARMQHLTSKATDILESVMADASLPAYARVAAAKIVIQNAYTGLQLDDHTKRLADIQALLKQSDDLPHY